MPIGRAGKSFILRSVAFCHCYRPLAYVSPTQCCDDAKSVSATDAVYRLQCSRLLRYTSKLATLFSFYISIRMGVKQKQKFISKLYSDY